MKKMFGMIAIATVVAVVMGCTPQSEGDTAPATGTPQSATQTAPDAK